jgi:hypothetical protein
MPRELSIYTERDHRRGSDYSGIHLLISYLIGLFTYGTFVLDLTDLTVTVTVTVIGRSLGTVYLHKGIYVGTGYTYR